VLVLAATGIYLYFQYSPIAEGFAHGTQLAHRYVGQLAVWTALVAGMAAVVAARPGRRRIAGALGGATLVTTLAASFTGFLLPWDQLGLWTVTVGTNAKGYHLLTGDDVRFVFFADVELSPDTPLRWLVVHVIVALVVFAPVVLTWRRVSRPAPPA
jgi:quinol-cytochrome oxidoreductase complex cytochrome b subunit